MGKRIDYDTVTVSPRFNDELVNFVWNEFIYTPETQEFVVHDTTLQLRLFQPVVVRYLIQAKGHEVPIDAFLEQGIKYDSLKRLIWQLRSRIPDGENHIINTLKRGYRLSSCLNKK